MSDLETKTCPDCGGLTYVDPNDGTSIHVANNSMVCPHPEGMPVPVLFASGVRCDCDDCFEYWQGFTDTMDAEHPVVRCRWCGVIMTPGIDSRASESCINKFLNPGGKHEPSESLT